MYKLFRKISVRKNISIIFNWHFGYIFEDSMILFFLSTVCCWLKSYSCHLWIKFDFDLDDVKFCFYRWRYIEYVYELENRKIYHKPLWYKNVWKWTFLKMRINQDQQYALYMRLRLRIVKTELWVHVISI